MREAAQFSVVETLRSGRQIEIRALRPIDEDAVLAAAERTSDRSLYQRFFGVKRNFSAAEVAAFLDVDFVDDVALLALTRAAGREVVAGGGRYIVIRPGMAELAFTVVDEFQGLGIASALLHYLVRLARAAGVTQLIAEVMPDNVAMLTVFEHSGLQVQLQRDSSVVHVTLHLA